MKREASLNCRRAHRVNTAWQRPLSAVHSIIMEKLAQADEDEGCTPTPFHQIYHHEQSCGVRQVYAPAAWSDHRVGRVLSRRNFDSPNPSHIQIPEQCLASSELLIPTPSPSSGGIHTRWAVRDGGSMFLKTSDSGLASYSIIPVRTHRISPLPIYVLCGHTYLLQVVPGFESQHGAVRHPGAGAGGGAGPGPPR